jgi:hypothetical protein
MRKNCVFLLLDSYIRCRFVEAAEVASGDTYTENMELWVHSTLQFFTFCVVAMQ